MCREALEWTYYICPPFKSSHFQSPPKKMCPPLQHWWWKNLTRAWTVEVGDVGYCCHSRPDLSREDEHCMREVKKQLSLGTDTSGAQGLSGTLHVSPPGLWVKETNFNIPRLHSTPTTGKSIKSHFLCTAGKQWLSFTGNHCQVIVH